MDIAVFAKSLQSWPLEECAMRVKSAGFDGLDLTVRPGGYVEPGNAFERRINDAVAIVRRAGLNVPLMTTGLTSASDPAAAPTLHAAAYAGVRELKLHYWPWDEVTNFADCVDQASRELEGLAKLAASAGVRINIHNHSGAFVNHSADAILKLLSRHDPEVVGAYVDPAHFTLEGGLTAWRSSMQALASRATLLAVKDFRWVDVQPDGSGPQERRWVPVGSGNVRFDESGKLLRGSGFNGAVSIHCEYQGRWSWKELDAESALRQAAADRTAFLNAAVDLAEFSA
jgi:sugar phosphate isomerase/epimerase